MEKVYELMIVVRAYLPDNVKNKVYSFIEELVADYKGKVLLKDIWGKRYMSYKIKSQREGYYVVYQVKLSADVVEEFSKKILKRDEIIRAVISLTNKKDVGVSYGKKMLSSEKN